MELNDNSKLILPAFTDLIKTKEEKQGGKVVFDFSQVTELLNKFTSEIDKIELYVNQQTVLLENLPENCNTYELFGTNVTEETV